MNLLIALLGLAFQAHPDDDRAVLLAIMSSETAFILPLSTIQRQEHVASATLVSVYAEARESWKEERRDEAVEIDCAANRWRILSQTRIARSGEARLMEAEPSAWEDLPAQYPPAVALNAILCEHLDPAPSAFPDWEDRLSDIRTILQ